MAESELNPQTDQDPLWRGVDLSGITVVLGPGGGSLVERLARQAAAAGGGLVIAVGHEFEPLREIQPLGAMLAVAALNARTRHLPLMDSAVDLLVMNGTLRQVPLQRLNSLLQEIWRVLAPGGQVRIADVLEPSEARYNEAWRARNELVSKLGRALDRPVSLFVNLRDAAALIASAGFEDLAVSILPGMVLTDAWLDSTSAALRAMAGRVGDPDLRRALVERDLPRLTAAYQLGQQRAAERFVLSGRKIGDLALTMRASFTEEDLVDDD